MTDLKTILEKTMSELDDVVIGKMYRSDFKESIKQQFTELVNEIPCEHCFCIKTTFNFEKKDFYNGRNPDHEECCNCGMKRKIKRN